MNACASPHPTLPSLEDLRWHIEQLLRETNLTNKALAERCNAHRDPHLGQGTPHVSADTIGRLRGIRPRSPKAGAPDPGFGVAYATVVHVYSTLLAQAHPVSAIELVTKLMVRTFTIRRSSERVADVLAEMGRNEFTFSPYEDRRGRKRVWRSLDRNKLQEMADRGDEEERLGKVIDEVEGGHLITAQSDERIRDLARRQSWDLCLVLAPRSPKGIITPYDLRRVQSAV